MTCGACLEDVEPVEVGNGVWQCSHCESCNNPGVRTPPPLSEYGEVAETPADYELLTGSMEVKRALHLYGNMNSLSPLPIAPGDTFLDVGCGGNALAKRLRALGFDAVGFDPYTAEADTQTLPKRKFTVVTSYHSLEHVPDPHAALRDMREVAGRWLIVRTPVTDSYAFRKFGKDWVQLDPPRHRIVFSSRALEDAVTRAGFKVVHTEREFSPFGLWASILTRRGIPWAQDTMERRRIFTHQQAWRKIAFARLDQADQVALYAGISDAV